MKLLLLSVIISAFFSLSAFGQESTPLSIVPENDSEKNADWISYFSNEQISIDYKFAACDPPYGYDQEIIILRYTNHTEQLLTVNFHEHLYFEGACKTCDSPEEYTYEILMAAGEVIEGSCDLYVDYSLKLFSKFINIEEENPKRNLTAFKLDQLQIKATASN